MASKWTSSANEALCLRLDGAPAPRDRVFHPDFTYPIFGEAETIFGYQDLHIHLSFASGSLRPCLDVQYKAKNTKTTAKVVDVAETLSEYLPADDLVAPSEWPATVAAERASFQPHGTRVGSYTRGKGEREFAVFRATFDTPGFREWHERVQIFALLFIEGASYIDDDDSRWEFYTLFERVQDGGESWHFVGYTSLYRFWCWPGQTRLRLSQFVILPPYQQQRHGSELYKTVYDAALNDDSICELTIEDPSERFDRLRDSCDLTRLQRDATLVAKLAAPMDRAWYRTARAQYKMAPRQWARILEMLALVRLGDEPSSLQAYRLQVKARLYGVNREVLDLLPREQRLEKLHETFEAVVDEYAEITGTDIPDALLARPAAPSERKRAADAEPMTSKMPRLL
ncbi:histone acetyltransferase [Malassezia caprae]|uniref:Histone acetyltransferase type B catalytic subunit n=1 Tax=Malassezia caprae TaxID=1381934 RepID=A0AAF0E8V5_9BASI|nr:histone acetyltransferase [Malassezia caprae]